MREESAGRAKPTDAVGEERPAYVPTKVFSIPTVTGTVTGRNE